MQETPSSAPELSFSEDEFHSLKKRLFWYEFLDMALEMVMLLVIFLTLQYFFFSPFVVSGHSMEPSLHDNEFIFVNRIGFTHLLGVNLSSLVRGDVIVFRPLRSKDYLIKRVIGLPGDHIRFQENAVIVNDVQLTEPYTNCKQAGKAPNAPLCEYPKELPEDIVVPKGHVFALGDNRQHSSDSRSCFGESGFPCTLDAEERFVAENNIVGKAAVVFWPLAQPKEIKSATFFDYFWPVNNPRGIESISPLKTSS